LGVVIADQFTSPVGDTRESPARNERRFQNDVGIADLDLRVVTQQRSKPKCRTGLHGSDADDVAIGIRKQWKVAVARVRGDEWPPRAATGS